LQLGNTDLKKNAATPNHKKIDAMKGIRPINQFVKGTTNNKHNEDVKKKEALCQPTPLNKMLPLNNQSFV